jgi:CysZ protein
MARIPASLLYALVNLFHRRIIWLMIWPVLLAAILWGAIAIAFWVPLVAKLARLIEALIERAYFVAQFDPSDIVVFASKVMLLLVMVPLVQFTALLILGIFGMSTMVEHVASRTFPGLNRQRGGSIWGSVRNGVAALGGLLALGLVSLPLWLFPPIWPFIPVAIFGWLNQRVLRYDALAEHASESEMRQLFRQERSGLLALGALLALVAYVPLVGLFAPVIFGLAFIHYLLGGLARLRAGPAEGEVLRGRV